MGTSIADSKKRVVIPEAKPGDVFDVQPQGEGSYLLVRLQRPKVTSGMTREACLDAVAETPLELTLTRDELRRQTREP